MRSGSISDRSARAVAARSLSRARSHDGSRSAPLRRAPADHRAACATSPGCRHLLPGVVDHHDRRAIARAETLDLDEREGAARVGLARLDGELRAQSLRSPARRRSARTTASGRRSARTCRPASCRTSCSTTRRLRRPPAVISRMPRDVPHRARGDEALLMLDQIQRRQDRRSLAIGRIAQHDRVEPGAILRRVDKRRPLRRPACGATCERWRRTPFSDGSSPVHVSHDDVDRPNHRDDVGNEAADNHLLERLAGQQRRRRAT